MKKIYLTLIISLTFFCNSFASMEFNDFVKSDDGKYGIAKYCIEGQVFITNFVVQRDGTFVPVGSPVQVFYSGKKRLLTKKC